MQESMVVTQVCEFRKSHNVGEKFTTLLITKWLQSHNQNVDSFS